MSTATPPVTRYSPQPESDQVVRALPSSLLSDWIKLTTVRSTWTVIGLTIGIGAVVAWACATFVTDEILTVSQVFNYSTVLTGVIAAIAGTVMFTSEIQHGTLAPALTALPQRSVFAASKAIVAAALGVTLGVVGLAASIAGSLAGGLAMGDSSSMLAGSLWAVLFTSMSAVLGLGVGMIVRHGSAAIAGLLVWGLVVENLLKVFATDQISRFMPFVAGNGMLGIETKTETGAIIVASLSRAQDALVFGGYALVALMIGALLLQRRDVN